MCASHVSCVAHMCHLWQLTCMLLLYGGGEPSHVSRVAINVHVTTIWWRGPSHVAQVCHVWQLTCTLLLYGGGEPSCVTHMHRN